jgi:uncharacterized protein
VAISSNGQLRGRAREFGRDQLNHSRHRRGRLCERPSLEPRTASVQIYLPVANLTVNVFVILAMGLAVGFISGMFGIGGGFLMTPLLIFLGISPAVAVASVTGHIAASSMSGAISYWRRRAIDLALAFMLLAGGFIGTASGVWLFTMLRAIGQLDITIGVSTCCCSGSSGR